MYWFALPLALLPAALHWWWTRSAFETPASAVLPERHLAVAQRVSFAAMVCTIAIVMIAHAHAIWLLPLQFVALTSTTYRVRLAMFGETWPFHRYLLWRLRFHVGMFGLWWFMLLASALATLAGPQTRWWLSGLAAAIAVAWHHWSGRVLLALLRATPLDRPDLDAHFQRVFAGARVPKPALWRAGETGARLANAFAIVTLSQRGVLFFDVLLDQLTPDEVTAILAHEVAHLEQFHARRLRVIYAVTSVLILLAMIIGTVTTAVAPGFEPWAWSTSVAAVFGAMWLRARRLQGHETDADLRAIELCGNPSALISALTRIYEINHIPRRWSAMAEEHASHPSLARRIRMIRDRMAAIDAVPEPFERLVVASSEPGRCAVIDHQRIAFLWIDGDLGDPATVLDRANRVEMMTYDQLNELRLSARRGAIELLAVGRHSRRWSMPIHERDAASVQAALDRIDHLVVVSAPRREHGVAQRTAAVLVIVLAAPYHAIGAVLVPALLALRRPQRPIMMTLAAALAGTAVASVNEREAGAVRFALLTILAMVVLWSARRRPEHEPQPDSVVWTWIEHGALLIPVVIGLVIAVASGTDLFGLHSAVRDRAWVTAAFAAVATFWFVQSGQRLPRRAGLGAAVVATASLVVGSPWFLLHAVADPLVAPMPVFLEKAMPTTVLAQQSVAGSFTAVHGTPDGNHFLLGGEYEEDVESEEEARSEEPPRFVIGGFDGWSREVKAIDAAVIDDDRLLVLNRDRAASHLRAEDLRSGQSQWTITLPDLEVERVQAASDGRWRAFARRGRQFERIDGRVGSAAVASTRWTVASDKQSYLGLPRNDGGTAALAVASLWQEPSLTWLLSDWHQRTRLLRVDATGTREIAASNLRVDCAAPHIDVTGIVCVSFDGRSSRFWRVDLSSGRLVPVGETRHIVWQLGQPSQHRIASVSNGRPLLADLESETVITLLPDKWCSASAIAISHDALIAACNDGRNTIATKYPLPADLH